MPTKEELNQGSTFCPRSRTTCTTTIQIFSGTLKTHLESGTSFLLSLYLECFFFLCSFYSHHEDERGKKVIKIFGRALFVCVALVVVDVVERKREGDRDGQRMRQRKRWDLWSHLFTRGLSPERPFTVVNHLHGVLKLRWMGSSDAFQTCLWYTLREIVDGSHSPCVGSDYSLKAKEHLWL